MMYFIAFLASGIFVAVATPFIARAAKRYEIMDAPDEPRKIHTRPIPLLGGVPIFFGLMAVLWFVMLVFPSLLGPSIHLNHVIGFSLGAFILILGGVLDEKYNLSPARQIVFPIIATLIIIGSGIGIRSITDPTGGVFSLVQWERIVSFWPGAQVRVLFPADLFTFFWLMIVMYTTKLLDGLDGLVSGITAIGAFMIFLLAVTTKFFQPEVGVFSILIAGAFLGFLFWNWHPAKIFLGTSGSTFAGFSLGILAIISGGKIATALLVLGIPIFDLLWVLLRRLILEGRSPMQADRKHLHFRLLDAGWSHRTVVLFYLGCAALFGMTTLFLQSRDKLIALGLLGICLIGLAVWVAGKKASKTL